MSIDFLLSFVVVVIVSLFFAVVAMVASIVEVTMPVKLSFILSDCISGIVCTGGGEVFVHRQRGLLHHDDVLW